MTQSQRHYDQQSIEHSEQMACLKSMKDWPGARDEEPPRAPSRGENNRQTDGWARARANGASRTRTHIHQINAFDLFGGAG